MDGIRVNMSSKEGKSKTLEPLPSGRYLVAVTDCDLDECGPNSDNAGKPMFKLEVTVQDGDYEGRKAWTNVMLFEKALYSISQMLKACGIDIREVGDKAEFQVEGYEPNMIPGPEYWMGKQFIIRTKLMPKRKDKNTGKEYDERTEIKGFMSPKDWNPSMAPKLAAPAVMTGGGAKRPSLLP